MQKMLIFANGAPNDGPMVRLALAASSDAAVVAADGGARVAWYYGRQVDTVIGDMDSLTEAELTKLEASGTVIKRYPQEKDETDLELTLSYAATAGATWIRIIGGLGDRFDQTLANVYLMALPQLIDLDVALVAGKQQLALIRAGEHQIEGQPGDTISLLPLGGDVQGITTTGMAYPLKNETLYFGPARGVSNVLSNEVGQVALTDGVLLVIHTIGRA
ncbi:thiamine diphosphokinase [Phototrophicus methaneseepsis]|uniref:Thiamine diphosphokinase n=1 Tax=Phototrophicus methaneseepsis TaxID=2710758 RepID=A0A7S8E892_9CHLR|nr:thiamine diphosphokinase [Phototrophicus methaneseepsis]QPC82194.1 thiamine diphosphokinase [Phototrophicus methaneseepsis]